MPFDSVMTRAVAEDLQQHLTGGRVDKIVQPADLTVALLIRAEQTNQWLVISALAQHASVLRTARKQVSGFSEPSPFVMLLRKYLESARLTAVTQVGVDRVIRCTFARENEEVLLLCEIMGRYSNIILANHDMTVLGAVKLVRSDENRVRVILPRHPYRPPPRPMQPPPHADRQKLDPIHANAGDLVDALTSLHDDAMLWKALLDLIEGLSPSVAREVTFQAAGAVDAVVRDHRDLPAATHVMQLVQARFAPSRGAPSAVWQGAKLVDYAAFPLHYHGIKPTLYADVMALLDTVLSEHATADPMAGQRAPLVAAIESMRKTARRKVASLEGSLVDEETLAKMRMRGEMVLSYQHAIEAGQSELTIPDLDLEIPVDPSLTPVENAQKYFKQYVKARDAAHKVPALLETAMQDLAYLEQLAVHAALANDPQALAAVREELRELSMSPEDAARRAKKLQQHDKRGRAVKGKPIASPLRIQTGDGTEILVGRSAMQNDAVTFNMAGPQDIWMHARQIPGAHVILRSGGKTPSQAALLEAATLAATYSQARAATTVPVDYTHVRNVRRIKGGKPGLVHYSGETTIVVRPRAP